MYEYQAQNLKVGDVIELDKSFDDFWRLARIVSIGVNYSPVNSGREPLYFVLSILATEESDANRSRSSYCYASEIVRKISVFKPTKTTLEFSIYV